MSSRIAVFLFAALAALGCSERRQSREVDFQDLESVAAVQFGNGAESAEPGIFTVCVAPILPAQEGYGPYLALVRHLERKSGISMRFVYPGSYRETLQWVEAGGVDLAFTCTGMFAGARSRSAFDLLATPVTGGRATTRAYLIVPRNSPARGIEDLLDGDFAFVDDLSLTGYLYPISRLGRREGLPVKAVFTGSHESSILLVGRGLANGASVDGIDFERIAAANPSTVENVRILEKSPEFGLPPVVVSTRIPEKRRALLLGLLTGLDSDSGGAELLRGLRLDRYIPADGKLYEPALELARQIDLR